MSVLDPDLAALLAELTTEAAAERPAEWPSADAPAAAARLDHEKNARRFTQPGRRAVVGEVHDRTVPGPAGAIPVRIYRPVTLATAVGAVLVVWFHGGGWITGSLDTGDIAAREICAGLGALVVSVDYRLAPEHPWPAGLEDAVAALRWVAHHAGDLDGDPRRILVGGDSAGGNIAAVLAQLASTTGPALAGQLLLYPAVDLDPTADDRYASRQENATGYGLTLDDVRRCSEIYAGGADTADPLISPIRAADLTGLPPAVIAVAQYDPLRDEGRAYAEALRAASVPVELHEGHGLIHGCYDMLGISPAVRAELDRVLASARRVVSR